VEDFLTEADLLCSQWKIETPISLDDGRAFVFEIQALYSQRFYDQPFESGLNPYESLYHRATKENLTDTEKDSLASDKWTESMAHLTSYFEKQKNSCTLF
jgi:hypothetical protein